MSWAKQQCFRDPVPISRDYFLCSHAPFDKFGLYVIDRYGNRELLYLDPEIGSMSPTLLRPVATPPVLGSGDMPAEKPPSKGQFFVADVYQGLTPAVKPGIVKYIRVCQEVRADLKRLPNGQYQADHEPFQDWYATPTHKVSGPYGWPSYVAKGVLGIAPVEEDGSANFYAPAGKVLYFQVLDADYNEIQRMRSVVQLQAGEKRGCIGCHENRMSAPLSAGAVPMAMRRRPGTLQEPPWGSGPFSYENVVQPVWDAKCVRCHNAEDKQQINLTGVLDADGIPASYRTIITKGLVHYFDYTWGREHSKAEPLSFGTVKSKLWEILDSGHYDVHLTKEQAHRIKCWTDLNCPLWPDYIFRQNRLAMKTAAK
jgi:cytochrome c553